VTGEKAGKAGASGSLAVGLTGLVEGKNCRKIP